MIRKFWKIGSDEIMEIPSGATQEAKNVSGGRREKTDKPCRPTRLMKNGEEGTISWTFRWAQS